MNFDTPILFLVFNRPEPTKLVFDVIRKVKPTRLYLASDGPRVNNVGDYEKNLFIKNYLVSNVDWDCNLFTLFRDSNLGCKIAVSSAISWFFENEEQGIILEDDCLPSISFFKFCELGLKKYKDDYNVCSISGNLRENSCVSTIPDVYKSKYFNMWGWATWRRQWNDYDVNFFLNNDNINLELYFLDKKERRYWNIIVKKMVNNEINTWDYQLLFISLLKGQFNIYPYVNLVKNIGFSSEATHTSDNSSIISKVDFHEVDVQYVFKEINKLKSIDDLFLNEYRSRNFISRIINKLSRFISSLT